jgi:glycosyltransferase involved in cell wall biosynthesis
MATSPGFVGETRGITEVEPWEVDFGIAQDVTCAHLGVQVSPQDGFISACLYPGGPPALTAPTLVGPGHRPAAILQSASPISLQKAAHSLMRGTDASAPRQRALRMAVIAPPWYPLPPRAYGGIELVVSLLVAELRRMGHEVTVFGAAGSAQGTTVLAPAGWAAHLGTITAPARELTYLARVFEAIRQQDLDLIHDHNGFAGLLCSTLLQAAPMVHTVHGPVDEPFRAFYEAVGGRASLVALSESQRRSAPELAWVGMVHNAVDRANLRLATRDEKNDYLVCLARISPDKGQHTAFEVARRSGRRLILAGKIEESPGGREYFLEHIEPYIDGDRIRYLAEVNATEKADLLARAHALLAPIDWAEPFGLSVVEAMVSGTPAISFARGSAPELIEHGRTGFVVSDVDEMVEAVAASGEIDPLACASLARARFHPALMAEAYERIYTRVLGPVGVAELPGIAGRDARAGAGAA